MEMIGPVSRAAARLDSKAYSRHAAARRSAGDHEANGACVEPGMPTVMWGIGGAAMAVVQQPQRITLLSELANQSRRILLDGRAIWMK
jgi:hypothetical protein